MLDVAFSPVERSYRPSPRRCWNVGNETTRFERPAPLPGLPPRRLAVSLTVCYLVSLIMKGGRSCNTSSIITHSPYFPSSYMIYIQSKVIMQSWTWQFNKDLSSSPFPLSLLTQLRKDQRRVIFKQAEQYVKEHRQIELDEIRMKREARKGETFTSLMRPKSSLSSELGGKWACPLLSPCFPFCLCFSISLPLSLPHPPVSISTPLPLNLNPFLPYTNSFYFSLLWVQYQWC